MVYLNLEGELEQSQFEQALEVVLGEGFKNSNPQRPKTEPALCKKLGGETTAMVQFNGFQIQIEGIEFMERASAQRLISGLIRTLNPVSYHSLAYEMRKGMGEKNPHIEDLNCVDFGDLPYEAPCEPEN